MGYCFRVIRTDFTIHEDNVPKAHKALKKWAKTKNHIAWADPQKIAKSRHLEPAMEELRWHLIFDDDGERVIDIEFEGEKLGDDAEFFEVIAPFACGEIECAGEDGEHWKWTFYNGEFNELLGTVVYDE